MLGFEPVYNKQSEILILGSFPSVISRRENFYYANPQNRFWKIIQAFFNVELNSIEDKKQFLLEHKIALWDIVESCYNVGSSDRDLSDIKFVDLPKVLPPFTNVQKILCNGKVSYDLTMQYITENNIKIPVVYLFSTSPANVKFKLEQWQEEFEKDFSK